MPDTRDSMTTAINKLASMSADQLAAYIQKLGIKGRLGTTYHCPLANLLTSQFGGQFVVGRKFIARKTARGVVKIPTPPSLATMVRKFDIGGYQNLIAPPPRCIRNEGTPKRPKQSPPLRGPNSKSGKHVLRHKHVIKHRISLEVGRFA